MALVYHYSYHGQQYTLNELTKISNLHRDTILRRLNMGWTVEDALDTPAGEKQDTASLADFGKQIPIVFKAPLPIFESMQPILGKRYIATLCGTPNKKELCKVFYIVQLENGKPLITYPGEFEEAELNAAVSGT